ncbi:hypothetical protein [Bradyrhizobium sp. NP1]|uniref:hypothetical protein n=1 Tax=Bradyrhizobium sp. NP1 TaxID=3049772 RepID=UPI0025A4DA70|nr:hypothetical protein [Bradyrhizobium sp. NP1]WJR80439.1 hypothetical protein QOU61_11980 [Bradyrhizobium sp. NP1]
MISKALPPADRASYAAGNRIGWRLERQLESRHGLAARQTGQKSTGRNGHDDAP